MNAKSVHHLVSKQGTGSSAYCFSLPLTPHFPLHEAHVSNMSLSVIF